ncbi:RTA1 domain-containing protein [Aspergillus homomorphus CBS 101889]|uniref:RTA1 like protein n=1 Tax=Aspergillus homomorphus (strain CBS 101889) TaxID=1450537 RepID=A0A395I7U9_ASPHC|nr:RTA1 like protein [Aspergillus homomorphus CBS 101889]RAL16300.1 RTA1 like protein [Aspergillus homomorphus CBS 101889]
MGYQYYHYNPSPSAAIPFAALFGLTAVVHIWQTVRARTWYLIPFIIGSIFEATGYLCRYISATETPDWTMKPYVGQQLLILLGPSLFAASIYMLLGRIIRVLNAGSISPIRPTWLTKIFVTGDVISFLLQSGGGGMQASAKDANQAQLGEHMILGGLFVQILFFGIFMIVSVIFHRRMLKTPLHHVGSAPVPWNKYLKVLYVVSLLILIRSLYRVAEYIQGKSGFLQSKEIFIYLLDAALMLTCCAIFNVWHPSDVVSGRQALYKQPEDLEMLNGGYR